MSPQHPPGPALGCGYSKLNETFFLILGNALVYKRPSGGREKALGTVMSAAGGLCEERLRGVSRGQCEGLEIKRESSRSSLTAAPNLLSSRLRAPRLGPASHLLLDDAVAQLTCPPSVLPHQGWTSRAILPPHHCCSGCLKC